MVLIYHGTPITPRRELLKLAGQRFCVSYVSPADLPYCREIGVDVLRDNGAFSVWKRGHALDLDCGAGECLRRKRAGQKGCLRHWLDSSGPGPWIVPDVIMGSEAENDDLLRRFDGPGGVPVWHMHESLDRLLRLVERYDYIAWGSSGEYATPRTPPWVRRAIQAWNVIYQRQGLRVHMLRGLSLAGGPFPFYSADSTDLARNHWRKDARHSGIVSMARKWERRAAATARYWTYTDERAPYRGARQTGWSWA